MGASPPEKGGVKRGFVFWAYKMGASPPEKGGVKIFLLFLTIKI
jgi:hypothetical protein